LLENVNRFALAPATGEVRLDAERVIDQAVKRLLPPSSISTWQ
jgi:hypothetical protein